MDVPYSGRVETERVVSPAGSLRFQAWRLRDTLRDRLRGTAHRREIFTRIYAGNLWGDGNSVSGHGSNLEATAAVRDALPELFREFDIRSVLDAPCGDFLWMKDVVRSLDCYTGMDIVPDLVAQNTARYLLPNVTFRCGDIAADPLPRADLVCAATVSFTCPRA